MIHENFINHKMLIFCSSPAVDNLPSSIKSTQNKQNNVLTIPLDNESTGRIVELTIKSMIYTLTNNIPCPIEGYPPIIYFRLDNVIPETPQYFTNDTNRFIGYLSIKPHTDLSIRTQSQLNLTLPSYIWVLEDDIKIKIRTIDQLVLSFWAPECRTSLGTPANVDNSMVYDPLLSTSIWNTASKKAWNAVNINLLYANTTDSTYKTPTVLESQIAGKIEMKYY